MPTDSSRCIGRPMCPAFSWVTLVALSVLNAACSGLVLNGNNTALPSNFMLGAPYPADSPTVVKAGAQAIKHWRSKVAEPENQPSESLVSVEKALHPRHEIALLMVDPGVKTDCGNKTGESKHPFECDYGHELDVLGLATSAVMSDNGSKTLGVALSGGGSRAGFFAVGALKALYNKGVLKHVHYLSTVSGGGYAAYWYYTQLSRSDAWKTPKQTPFDDCFPGRNGGLYESFDKLKPIGDAIDCQSDGGAANGKDRASLFPAQTYLSSHTDLLAEADNQLLDNLPEYLVKMYPFAGAIAYPLLPSHPSPWVPGFLSAIPHHVANTIFDWSWNGSFYGTYYRSSLHRVWGSDASGQPDCNQEMGSLGKPLEDKQGNVPKSCLYYSQSNKSESLNKPESLTERTLQYWKDKQSANAKEAERRPYPIWIINTMGLPINSLWTACTGNEVPPEHRLHVFEFTPFGYGSGLFGYFHRTDHVVKGPKGLAPTLMYPRDLDPLQAVHASGAAFDSAAVKNQLARCSFRLAEQLGNFALGLRISNPVFDGAERVFHRALPWPLYYLHGERNTARNSEIYLTDGGHIDNLGIYSLIRRRVGIILAFDATEDGDGDFDDLQKTSARLAKEGIGISLDGLCTRTDHHRSPCADGRNYESKFDPMEAKQRIFNPLNATHSVFFGKYYRLDDKERHSIGQLVYVKSSLPEEFKEGPVCDKEANKAMPCTTMALLKQKGKDGGGWLSGKFPNNTTLGIVLDSKKQTYWAYRDLAHFLSTLALEKAPGANIEIPSK